MSYRTFRDAEEQTTAEAALPDRFEDGSTWLTIADNALSRGGARRFEPAEWAALSGMPIEQITETVTASEIWDQHDDYESARLSARFVTLAGLDSIAAKSQEMIVALRSATAPDDIRGLRLALYILDQATVDPDRRATFIKLLRDNDALGVALYRKAEPAKVEGIRDKIKKLKPGECIPLSEIPESMRRMGADAHGLRYKDSPDRWCKRQQVVIGFYTGARPAPTYRRR